jgi:hypothetical protein
MTAYTTTCSAYAGTAVGADNEGPNLDTADFSTNRGCPWPDTNPRLEVVLGFTGFAIADGAPEGTFDLASLPTDGGRLSAMTLYVSAQSGATDAGNAPYRSYTMPLSGTVVMKRLGYVPVATGILTDAAPPADAFALDSPLIYEVQISRATITSTADTSGGLYPATAMVDATMDWIDFTGF